MGARGSSAKGTKRDVLSKEVVVAKTGPYGFVSEDGESFYLSKFGDPGTVKELTEKVHGLVEGATVSVQYYVSANGKAYIKGLELKSDLEERVDEAVAEGGLREAGSGMYVQNGVLESGAGNGSESPEKAKPEVSEQESQSHVHKQAESAGGTEKSEEDVKKTVKQPSGQVVDKWETKELRILRMNALGNAVKTCTESMAAGDMDIRSLTKTILKVQYVYEKSITDGPKAAYEIVDKVFKSSERRAVRENAAGARAEASRAADDMQSCSFLKGPQV